MLLSHITSLNYLSHVKSDFDFVEAAWCTSQGYFNYFGSFGEPNKPLVLDNSTHVLGAPIDNEYVFLLAREFVKGYNRQDVTVVVPDVKCDSESTVLLARDYLEKYWKRLRELGVRIMIVPQGSTFEKYALCESELWKLAIANFDMDQITIGFPFRTEFPNPHVSEWGYQRVKMVEYVLEGRNRTDAVTRIHLLGQSDPGELVEYRMRKHLFKKVRVFNDSSAAFGYAKEGREIKYGGWKEMKCGNKPGPVDLMEESLGSKFERLLVNNAVTLRTMGVTS